MPVVHVTSQQSLDSLVAVLDQVCRTWLPKSRDVSGRKPEREVGSERVLRPHSRRFWAYASWARSSSVSQSPLVRYWIFFAIDTAWSAKRSW